MVASDLLFLGTEKRPDFLRTEEARPISFGWVVWFEIGLRSHRDFIIAILAVKSGNCNRFSRSFPAVPEVLPDICG